jgi:membrane associated rhomboid family serine protease
MPAVERRPDRYEGLPQEAREKLAIMDIKMAREGAGNEAFAEYRPENWWEWVVGLLGMPIEQNTNYMRTLPLATWCLAAAITAISVFAFIALPTAARDYGFIPAHPLRYGGLTLLTSFLLHGSILHLLSNLYFLLIFGDNVEEWLGRRKFLLLILCATLAGDLLHLIGNASSNTPCIGASGGVSGILAFYALTFPHAKLGFLMRFYLWFRWITLPAYALFALWVILQFVGAWMQVSGFSHVAALAHLGGTGVGLIFWLATRKD